MTSYKHADIYAGAFQLSAIRVDAAKTRRSVAYARAGGTWDGATGGEGLAELLIYHNGFATVARPRSFNVSTLYDGSSHSLAGFSIGGARSKASSSFNEASKFSGDVAEVIAFEHVLTRPQISRVHAYLISKYGLSISAAPAFGGARIDASVTQTGPPQISTSHSFSMA